MVDRVEVQPAETTLFKFSGPALVLLETEFPPDRKRISR